MRVDHLLKLKLGSSLQLIVRQATVDPGHRSSRLNVRHAGTRAGDVTRRREQNATNSRTTKLSLTRVDPDPGGAFAQTTQQQRMTTDMAPIKDPAWALAEHVCGCRFLDLPATTRAATCNDILDTFGCLLGGSGEPGIAELVRVVGSWGSLEQPGDAVAATAARTACRHDKRPHGTCSRFRRHARSRRFDPSWCISASGESCRI